MDATVCMVALVVTLVMKIEEVQHINLTQGLRNAVMQVSCFNFNVPMALFEKLGKGRMAGGGSVLYC